jgi:hypothetical protein
MPVQVEFDNGETHNYSLPSSYKLKVMSQRRPSTPAATPPPSRRNSFQAEKISTELPPVRDMSLDLRASQAELSAVSQPLEVSTDAVSARVGRVFMC